MRLPAAFCGTFGHKTTVGLWPTAGVFPLSPTLDSIGPLTHSAADAAIVFTRHGGSASGINPRTAARPADEPLLRQQRPARGALRRSCGRVPAGRARRQELCRSAAVRFAGLDGVVSPTTTMLAPPLAAFADDREALRLAFAISQNTQPGNLLNLCGTSTPIQGQTGVALPVGLQVLCPGGEDARLFSIALSLEDIFGSQPKPDVAALL